MWAANLNLIAENIQHCKFIYSIEHNYQLYYVTEITFQKYAIYFNWVSLNFNRPTKQHIKKSFIKMCLWAFYLKIFSLCPKLDGQCFDPILSKCPNQKWNDNRRKNEDKKKMSTSNSYDRLCGGRTYYFALEYSVKNTETLIIERRNWKKNWKRE